MVRPTQCCRRSIRADTPAGLRGDRLWRIGGRRRRSHPRTDDGRRSLAVADTRLAGRSGSCDAASSPRPGRYSKRSSVTVAAIVYVVVRGRALVVRLFRVGTNAERRHSLAQHDRAGPAWRCRLCRRSSSAAAVLFWYPSPFWRSGPLARPLALSRCILPSSFSADVPGSVRAGRPRRTGGQRRCLIGVLSIAAGDRSLALTVLCLERSNTATAASATVQAALVASSICRCWCRRSAFLFGHEYPVLPWLPSGRHPPWQW